MASPRFASKTSVPVDRTRAEIERTLASYGATRFMHGWEGDQVALGFTIGDRTIRFMLVLPRPPAAACERAPRRGRRTPEAAARLWEQACRQRWRALLLVIRAKLEAAAVGISTIEDEFLAWTVLPGARGATVGDVLRDEIRDRIAGSSTSPLLLPGGE